jgi:hypothetical protein
VLTDRGADPGQRPAQRPCLIPQPLLPPQHVPDRPHPALLHQIHRLPQKQAAHSTHALFVPGSAVPGVSLLLPAGPEHLLAARRSDLPQHRGHPLCARVANQIKERLLGQATHGIRAFLGSCYPGCGDISVGQLVPQLNSCLCCHSATCGTFFGVHYAIFKGINTRNT